MYLYLSEDLIKAEPPKPPQPPKQPGSPKPPSTGPAAPSGSPSTPKNASGPSVDYDYWYPSGTQATPPGPGWEKVPSGLGWRRPKGMGGVGPAPNMLGAGLQTGNLPKPDMEHTIPSDMSWAGGGKDTVVDAPKSKKTISDPSTPANVANWHASFGEQVDPTADTAQMPASQGTVSDKWGKDTGYEKVANAMKEVEAQKQQPKPAFDASQFAHYTPEQHQEAYNQAFQSGDAESAKYHLSEGLAKQKKKEHFDALEEHHQNTSPEDHEAFAAHHEQFGNPELADWHRQKAAAKKGNNDPGKAPSAEEGTGAYSPEDALTQASHVSHRADAKGLHASIKSHLEDNPHLTPEQREIAEHVSKIAEFHANQKGAPSPEGQKQLKQAMSLAKKHGLHKPHKKPSDEIGDDGASEKRETHDPGGMGFSGAFHAARARAMGLAGSASSGYAAGHIGSQLGQYATTEAARVGHKLLHGGDPKGDKDGAVASRALSDAEREAHTRRAVNPKNSTMNFRR